MPNFTSQSNLMMVAMIVEEVVYINTLKLVMQMESLKLIVLLIVVGFGLIVVLTQFLASGVTRGVIVGWICLVFSLCVFVAPLGVLVSIKTRDINIVTQEKYISRVCLIHMLF